MTTATAQTITVDRDELRDITLQVGAMSDYLFDLLDYPETKLGPFNRLSAIHGRLMVALDFALPDGSEIAATVEEAEALEEEAYDLGHAWLKEDREVLGAAIGKKIFRCLEAVA